MQKANSTPAPYLFCYLYIVIVNTGIASNPGIHLQWNLSYFYHEVDYLGKLKVFLYKVFITES